MKVWQLIVIKDIINIHVCKDRPTAVRKAVDTLRKSGCVVIDTEFASEDEIRTDDFHVKMLEVDVLDINEG